MNIISNALGHVLRIIFELVQNYGLSIILFTIVVKVLLLPLTIKQTKSTKAMQDIQPKILEIQSKYKDKPEKQQQEIMKIYTEAKINPLAGCLPLLIQMPILIALFSVLREPVTYGVFVDQVLKNQSGHFPCSQNICLEYWDQVDMTEEQYQNFLSKLEPHHVAMMISSKANMSADRYKKLLETAKERGKLQK